MPKTVLTLTETYCHSLVEPEHIEYDGGIWGTKLQNTFLVRQGTQILAVWELGTFLRPTPAKEAEYRRRIALQHRREGNLDLAWASEEMAHAIERGYPIPERWMYWPGAVT
jgi:hypothetical protein